MKKILLFIVCALAVVTAGAVVKPGVEVLRDGGFAQLQGKRVGLVTNPSGIDNNLKSRYDPFGEDKNTEQLVMIWEEGNFDDLYYSIFLEWPEHKDLPSKYR